MIGLAEVLGAVGLIVPWATRIVPVLTPVAAVGLAVLMAGAAQTHRRRKEPAIVLAIIAAVIAVGRFGVT